jgi:hypothetical protein
MRAVILTAEESEALYEAVEFLNFGYPALISAREKLRPRVPPIPPEGATSTPLKGLLDKLQGTDWEGRPEGVAAREAVEAYVGELEKEIKARGEIYGAMCERLHGCCQKYHLGLGGEHVDRLIIEEVDRLHGAGHDVDCPSRDGFYPENCECSHRFPVAQTQSIRFCRYCNSDSTENGEAFYDVCADCCKLVHDNALTPEEAKLAIQCMPWQAPGDSFPGEPELIAKLRSLSLPKAKQ